MVTLLWQTTGLEVSYNQWTGSNAKGLLERLNLSHQLLAEERFTFQKSIATVAYDHTLLSYVSTGKYTFNLKGAKSVPRKGADGKRQITATFAVSATGNFLPMQLIHTGKTKRCLPNLEFPRSFLFTYTENHLSNQLKATEHFEKVIFPYLDQINENMAYPKE